jgi:hypothetical protein
MRIMHILFRPLQTGLWLGLLVSLWFVGLATAALVGHLDIAGGGMVDGKGTLAVVGHMEPPYATTLLEVADPANPRILSRIKARPGTHSHKARNMSS